MLRPALLLLVTLALPAHAQRSWCPVDRHGFGTANNVLAVATVEFGGALWIGTWNAGGAELRRYDGATTAAVAIPGLSAANEGIACGVVHQNALVLGTFNPTSGAEVWRYDGASWSQLGSAGLGGGAAAPAIDRLAVYNGQLYAGLENQLVGSQVKRFQSAGNWTQVNSDGFGCGTNNEEVYGLTAWAGDLYATTNNNTGCQVWRWNGLSAWARVDQGGVGCGPGGFGSGGADTGAHALEVVSYWPGMFLGTENANGAEVWHYDGVWTSLITDGFGDPNNFIVHDFQQFGPSVFAVTENASTGCEVWEFSPFTGAIARRVDPFGPNGEGGFGEGADNELAFELAEFQGRLVVTTLNAARGAEVWELGLGAPYCTANVNSTGAVATICAEGSATAALNDLTLTVFRLPLGTVGYFLTSRLTGFVPNAGGSSGNLCLGGSVGRYNTQVLGSGPGGTYSLVLNLPATPQPTGLVSITAGETWHFQSWYRDAVGGAPTSNFSNALFLFFE